MNSQTSLPQKCSYLPNCLSILTFIDPYFSANITSQYDELSQYGFRRSGEYIYRPNCQSCDACISVRIPVQYFTPCRSQKRVWKKNQDLTISVVAPMFEEEHFELYCRYIQARHQENDEHTPESYLRFLTSYWSRTVFYEFRLEEKLLAVAVVDHVKNGLSAVYTFFDPDYSERGLGTFAILWEIEECKRLNRNWLYLGYWVKNCHKMNYKTNYKPLEFYYQGKWQHKILDV